MLRTKQYEVMLCFQRDGDISRYPEVPAGTALEAINKSLKEEGKAWEDIVAVSVLEKKEDNK